MSNDVWTYPATMVMEPNVDVSGYDVEATDGSIGKVDEATYDTGRSYLVVDTGPWIFGKKVMLPAGVVRDIDDEREKGLRRPDEGRDQSVPEYHESGADDDYRGQLGSYYDSTGDPRSNPSNESLM